jgi:phenylalanyl-tRNA synthetase beta chain
MRVSLRWLRELLPELPNDAVTVGERLTSVGLAVDGLDDLGARLRALQVVAVRAISPHPKRDQLRLVDIDRGSAGTQQVVCGAPNVPAPGGLVVLAPLGARLPGMDAPLGARDIGGVRSEGMLCSEAELGVTDKADGILILPPGAAAPGSSVVHALPELDDVIYELDITPNRPDALGHVGIARDLAASFKLAFGPAELRARLARSCASLPAAVTRPALGNDVVSDTERAAFDSLQIQIDDPERCPRYGAAAAAGVSILPSPELMRWRLHRLGIRPISNVVDITNWLLLLFGQPLHSFDWDKLHGNRIGVRRANDGEAFTTLDGEVRKLTADDLLITDGAGPTALAGVMGGLHSEIVESTTRVLLECAYFTPRGVRRTSRRQGLHTESSHRFERGVDWNATHSVLEHAQALMSRLAAARWLSPIRVVEGQTIPQPSVALRFARQDALLGIQVPPQESIAILQRHGFEVLDKNAEIVTVRVPSHRPDVSREVDLIEEVARINGLDQIPTRIPARVTQMKRTTGQQQRELSDIAVNLGLSEALLYGFTSEQMLANINAAPAVVRIENPLSEDRNVMRTSLLPGLLEALGRARRRGEANVRLYAMGSVFLPPNTPQSERALRLRPRDPEDAELPVEAPRFAAVIAGARPTWLKKPEPLDVYDAKGLALELVERYLAMPATVVQVPQQPQHQHLHPRGAADVRVQGQTVGWFGPLHPAVIDALDLGETAFVIELDLAAIEGFERLRPKYRPLIRVPGIIRDVSFEVPYTLPAGAIVDAMAQSAGELCESVEPFDLFEGEGLATGCRALAFRLLYRDPKAKTKPDEARTLTDAEVDARQRQVLETVSKQFGLALRG